ncbi:MAG TPA: DUF6599 family protein [Thermoanaerobaculia bacterium]|nr:DUF6599 family protein [Thermoanaerobaculia bacterium]
MALLLTLALLGGACDGRKGVTRAAVVPPQQEDNYTAYDSPSLQFLPRQQEAPGWQLEEDPIVVPGNRLVRYLDRDGMHFARYEAIDLTVGKYKSTAAPSGFATIEIFRFPDFVKAFGAYSTRKLGQVQFLDVPNESFQSRHSVHLWRGPFYVRVMGGGTADGNESLKRLLAFVAEKMPAAPSKPAVFNFFPATNRIVNSERFDAEQGFGQPFLANSFQASFTVDGEQLDGLIIPAANKPAAAKILDAYRRLYIRNGKLLDPIPNLGEDNFTAEDKYLGRAVAFRLDRFVIAFTGFKERQHLVDLAVATDQRILGGIRKQLNVEESRASGEGDRDQRPAWMRR